MIERNWLDRCVGFFSPRAELHRLRSKAQIQIASRSYEASSKGRRTAGWTWLNTSAREESKMGLAQLRNVSRQAVRNNPYMSRAQEAMVTNIVGSGIIGKLTHPNQSQQNVLRIRWKRWAESTECDSNRQNNLYGLQALCVRSVFESGEVFIRKRVRRLSDGLSVPLQLQVLESDFCDVDHEEQLKNGNVIMQGIEFDRLGKVVAYWFRRSHPGDSNLFNVSYERVRVPVDEVIHIFEQKRPGQIRGIPEPHAVLVRMNDLDDHEQAQLIKQKVSSAFCAFVYDQQAVADEPSNEPLDFDMLEPGTIENLGSGKDIKFSNPPSVTDYDNYTTAVLRSIASGLKIPTEILMSDYSKVNYSSARMSWIEFNRMIERRRWQIYIPKMLDPIGRWFLDAIQFVESIDSSVAAFLWTPPRRSMIDPTKEVPATIKSIRAGLTSISEAQRELGFDSDELFDEIKEDFKKIDELELVLDCDPRRTTQVGMKQQEEGENSGNETD